MSSSRGDFSPTTEQEKEPFRMLAIYDSEETGAEAAHASELVLRELGDDVAVTNTAWDLQSLEDDSKRAEAAEEAARADVIVVALSGTEPTMSFKNWAESWQEMRNLESGLLALIPSGESKSGGELADFLYETAVTAHMDFLSQTKSRI